MATAAGLLKAVKEVQILLAEAVRLVDGIHVNNPHDLGSADQRHTHDRSNSTDPDAFGQVDFFLFQGIEHGNRRPFLDHPVHDGSAVSGLAVLLVRFNDGDHLEGWPVS